MQRLNFGKNISVRPAWFYEPRTEQEVLQLLDKHRGERIRVIGRLHSWSRIIECDEVLIDLRHLDQVEPMSDGETKSVQVGGGCQIKRLLHELEQQKRWTLPSVGFISEQTVAGAISTGTHGSGKHSLSHYAISVRVAQYDPKTGLACILEIDNGDALRAVRCSLGCLGVILSVRMQCRETYSVEEHFHEYRQLSEVVDAEMRYPLQQFYLVPWRWTYFVQHRREVDAPRSATGWIYLWYRFLALDIALHLFILLMVRWLRFRQVLRSAYRWHIPVFVIQDWRTVNPSSAQLVMEHELFSHLEIELFVQRSQLEAAMSFVTQTLMVAGHERKEARPCDPRFEVQLTQAGCGNELIAITGIYCHHYPICVRKILLDDTLISMASLGIDRGNGNNSHTTEEPWYSITLTNFMRRDQRQAFVQVVTFMAKNMAKLFDARPHWGKLCPLTAGEMRELFPNLERFQQQCDIADPNGQFRNDWTEAVVGRPVI